MLINYIVLFVVIYFCVMVLVYVYTRKTGVPFMLPGDIYIHKGTNRIYIPIGTSLIISAIIFLIAFRFLPHKANVVNTLLNQNNDF